MWRFKFTEMNSRFKAMLCDRQLAYGSINNSTNIPSMSTIEEHVADQLIVPGNVSAALIEYKTLLFYNKTLLTCNVGQ